MTTTESITGARPDQTTDGMPLIWQLADSMWELEAAAIPEEARRQGIWCLVDTLGCIIAGEHHPDAEAFAASEAPVFASTGDGHVIRAARQWAFQGDVFELNDLVGGHASIGTVSAVLSELHHRPQATAEELVLATVVGIETTTRLFEAHSWEKKPYADSGLVVTSILSSVGVAAALGRLRGLGRQEFRHALSLACATAAWGPSEVIFGQGGLVKPSQFGAGPAEAGMRAVLMARAGLTGPPRILESPMGFFTTVAHGFDRDMVLGGSGWRIEHAQRKLHACCGYIHATLDALADLVDRGVELDRATEIHIRVPAAVAEAVAKDRDPESANDARFHLRYMAALTATGHYPIRPEHSTDYADFIQRPEVRAAMDRITLDVLAEVPRQEGNRFNSSSVRVRLGKDGDDAVTAVCDAPRGTFRNPLSGADLAEKFTQLAGTVIGPEAVRRLASLMADGSDRGPGRDQVGGPDDSSLVEDLRHVLDHLSEGGDDGSR